MRRGITQLAAEMGNPETRCWVNLPAAVLCVLLLSVLVLIACASSAPAAPTPAPAVTAAVPAITPSPLPTLPPTKAPQAPVAGVPAITPSPLPTLSPTIAPQPLAVKPATAIVDDAVSAILAGVADEQALFADAEKDAELITFDSQAISDFGQSYNENES